MHAAQKRTSLCLQNLKIWHLATSQKLGFLPSQVSATVAVSCQDQGHPRSLRLFNHSELKVNGLDDHPRLKASVVSALAFISLQISL